MQRGKLAACPGGLLYRRKLRLWPLSFYLDTV